jgi:hypothetical protein
MKKEAGKKIRANLSILDTLFMVPGACLPAALCRCRRKLSLAAYFQKISTLLRSYGSNLRGFYLEILIIDQKVIKASKKEYKLKIRSHLYVYFS